MSNQVHPFPVNPVLTAISLAYKNQRYIADEVLPRVKVSRESFKYRVFDKDLFLTLPDTRLGRKGEPNEVELSYNERTDSVLDYGLADVVPLADVLAAEDGYNPQAKAVEYLTELIALDREKRVADLVFNADTYANSNKISLSGVNRFNNADSDPISVILTGLDACFYRPNVMVMGREVFSALCTHKKIVGAIYPAANGNGIVTMQQLANIFGVDKVLVGDSRLNSAKKGAAPTVVRAWGKNIALLYVNPLATTNNMPTFGITAELGNRESGTIDKPNAGRRGSTLVRVTESVKELVVAPDLGYYIQNAVA